MKYRAFISYKHLTSTGFAERLELALKSYAKPLWQKPIAIFRDEKYLKPGLDLPRMIADALHESEFLIFLASPQAAESAWVQDELSQWCSVPERVSRLIIVLTEGSIDTDKATKKINWEATDVLPKLLSRFLQAVPLYVDARPLSDPSRQTLTDTEYQRMVNLISASLRGIDPIEMSGQEIITYHKNLRKRNILIGSAIFALLLAAISGSVALRRAREEAMEARIARASQLASEAEAANAAKLPQRALLLAVLAAEITRAKGEPVTSVVEQTLRDLLATAGGYGMKGDSNGIETLMFVQRGAFLVSLGISSGATLWQIGDDGRGSKVHELIAKEEGRIVAAQPNDDERTIRILTDKGHVVARRLDGTSQLLRDFRLPDFQPQEEVCATKITLSKALQVSNHGVLSIWNVAQNSAIPPVRQQLVQNALGGCAISNDGEWVYAAGDGIASVLTSVDARPFHNLLPADVARAGPLRVTFRLDSSQTALAMKKGGVCLIGLNPQHRGEVARIPVPADENVMLAYSRSGTVLAIAGGSGTVRFWNVAARAPKFLGSVKAPFAFYEEMDGRIFFERDDTLAIVSDGLRAAAAIPLTKDFAPMSVQVLHNHPSKEDVSGDRATPYAFEPGKSILVTAGEDNEATVWKMEKNVLKQRDGRLFGHEKAILALRFSPDGKWLVSGGYDGLIRVWPVDPPQWIASPSVLSSNPDDLLLNDGVPNPHGGVQFVRFLLGDKWLEAHGENSNVRIGKLDQWGRFTKAVTPTKDNEFINVDRAEAEQLRRASYYPPLHRRRVSGMTARGALEDQNDMAFEFTAGESSLAEAQPDGTIRLWDDEGSSPASELYRGLGDPAVSIAIARQDGLLAGATAKGQLAVWRIRAPEKPQVIGDLVRFTASARLLAGARPDVIRVDDQNWKPPISFLGNGRWLLVDYRYLLDLKSPGPVLWKLPDGAQETAKMADCCVIQLFADRFELWQVGTDVTEPRRLKQEQPKANVTAYALSSTSGPLILGLLDGRVLRLDFDRQFGNLTITTVTSHDFAIRSVAISPDGHVVAAGSPSGITMTELADDRSVVRHIRLKGHRGNVETLVFSARGQWLASGGEDDTVHVFPVKVDEVLHLACAVARRGFSESEKNRVPEIGTLQVCQPGADPFR